MNEGLEKFGERKVAGEAEYEGRVFASSAVESITLPSTLRRIETFTFFDCMNLRKVEIPNGVERIGSECFKNSGVEEITLPHTLREVG